MREKETCSKRGREREGTPTASISVKKYVKCVGTNAHFVSFLFAVLFAAGIQE